MYVLQQFEQRELVITACNRLGGRIGQHAKRSRESGGVGRKAGWPYGMQRVSGCVQDQGAAGRDSKVGRSTQEKSIQLPAHQKRSPLVILTLPNHSVSEQG